MIDFLNKSAALWGYTEELVPVSYQNYLNWIKDQKHTPLNYLSDHRKDLRGDIKSFYPKAMSALVFLFDYTKTKKALLEKNPKHKLAAYSLGFNEEDYHYFLGKKLQYIGEQIASDIPKLEFKISLDIHPVLERDLAFRAGLGWFGKNSMLINREIGSFTMIGSLFFNQKLPLNSKKVDTDHCGQCTRCADACPTAAIDLSTRTVTSEKCISTYTIELFKDAKPPKGYPAETKEVFGCDICQEVCPWNAKPLERAEIKSFKEDSLIEFFNRDTRLILKELEMMSNKSYKEKFQGTSLERLGKKGLIKNLDKF